MLVKIESRPVRIGRIRTEILNTQLIYYIDDIVDTGTNYRLTITYGAPNSKIFISDYNEEHLKKIRDTLCDAKIERIADAKEVNITNYIDKAESKALQLSLFKAD